MADFRLLRLISRTRATPLCHLNSLQMINEYNYHALCAKVDLLLTTNHKPGNIINQVILMTYPSNKGKSELACKAA